MSFSQRNSQRPTTPRVFERIREMERPTCGGWCVSPAAPHPLPPPPAPSLGAPKPLRRSPGAPQEGRGRARSQHLIWAAGLIHAAWCLDCFKLRCCSLCTRQFSTHTITSIWPFGHYRQRRFCPTGRWSAPSYAQTTDQSYYINAVSIDFP